MLEALAKVDPEPKTQLPLLLDVLKKDRDWAVLALAATSVGDLGPPAKTAVPFLKEVQRVALVAQPTADPQGVRKAVLAALGKIDPEVKGYVPVLVDVLQRDPDADVRLAALAALKKLGPRAKGALPVLLEIQKNSPFAKDEKEKAVALEAESTAKAIRTN
jgi:HEAT repeat protein